MSEGHTERLEAALDGRYLIERKLGEGGMASVYLAQDVKHERKVALKILKPELAAVIGAERFLSEIKTTANLQHPHILALFDSGEAGGYLYYVMPYIEGETLREKLDREKQLGVEESVRIARDVADALDYAHRNDVIHRDIKPGNILLHDGRPVVADFGIALAVSAAGGGRMTETGLSLGTPHYMSPEQASADRDLSARSDVYSLGCVLYEMLGGQPPHTGPSAQSILVHILTKEATPLTELRHTVPPNVAATVAKSIEKLPADRFETANAFMEALGDDAFRYHEQQTTSTGAPTAVVGAAAAEQTLPRRPWAFDVRTVVAALAIVLAGWGWLRPDPSPPVVRASLRLDDFSLRPLGEVMVSPDGTRFAVAGLDVPGPIYWRNAEEDEFRPIPGTEGAEYAAFSPDGQTLVFGTATGGTIQRVALSGGAPQLVASIPTPSVGGIDWGDDGSVVFTRNQGIGLYRVPATGGEPEELLEPAVRLRNPKLLPGGRAVIFTDLPTLSTHLLDLGTGSVTVLRAGAIDAVYVESGHLVFADVAGTVWAAPFDPAAGELVGESVTVFDGLAKPQPQYARFSVSRNGTLVYGTGLAGLSADGLQLMIVDLDGNEEAVPLSPRDFREVRWSPDGASIAYASSVQQDAFPNIFSYNVELGTTPRQLTFEGANYFPVFSPDGNRVAFSSERAGTDLYDLFVKNLDDDEPARSLITLPDNQAVKQWPSDTLIVFEQLPEVTGLADLWMLNISDPQNPVAMEYLPSEAALRDIRVSPDGTLAAYTSFSEPGATEEEVYVRTFPEPGGPTLVSQGGGQKRLPMWAPDGNTLYYWSVQAGPDPFIAARIQRDPTPVVLSRDTLFAGFYIPWSSDLHPDGDRLVVPQDASQITNRIGTTVATERFVVVTNWFEELRQRLGEN